MAKLRIKRYSLISKIVHKVDKFLKSIEGSPWWKRNYDRYLEIRRIYLKKNAKRIKAYNRRWHRKNAESVAARKHQWYLDHKEQVLEYGKQWAKNNPEKVREQSRKQWQKRKLKADRYINQSVNEVKGNENVD